jgi:hypothetical protein
MSEQAQHTERPSPGPAGIVLTPFSQIQPSLEPSKNAMGATADRALLQLAALALDQRTKPKDARFILRRARKMVRNRGVDVALWLRRIQELMKVDDLHKQGWI